MFNLFGSKTAKDLMEEAKETYSVPEGRKLVHEKEQKEYYRVGCTDDGKTTLTLMSDIGYGSMTLTMNQEACEQLIRMLQSTFQEVKITEETE